MISSFNCDLEVIATCMLP